MRGWLLHVYIKLCTSVVECGPSSRERKAQTAGSGLLHGLRYFPLFPDLVAEMS